MRWSVRRAGVIATMACGMALASAVPAFAKGPAIEVHVTASVTGPGLAAPVVLRWGGNCPFPEFCGSSGSTKGLDGYSFLNSAGVFGHAITVPGPASAAVLGPKYEITYRAVSGAVVMAAHQDLYPFGPGTSKDDPQRAWLYAQPGQRLFTAILQGGWIMAPTSLVSILRDHGFDVPAPPPSTYAAAPAAAANAPAPQPDGPAPWALGLGAFALAGMVVAGAIVGRGRSAKRAMRPAATH